MEGAAAVSETSGTIQLASLRLCGSSRTGILPNTRRMLRHLLVAAALCSLLAAAPAAAQAAGPTLTPDGQVARPGRKVVLRATFAAGRPCALRIDRWHGRVIPGDARSILMTFRVASDARAGDHHVSLRCRDSLARVRVRVARIAGNGRGHGPLFLGHRVHLRVRQFLPPVVAADPTVVPRRGPFPHAALRASAAAEGWWIRVSSIVISLFRNGQCIDWAEEKRPDIVQSVDMSRFDLLGLLHAVTDWNANSWTEHAVHAGLPVGHVPRVGAIVVFQSGVYGAASPFGHVAFVEAVDPAGSFTVSQMHAPHLAQVTTQTYPARVAAGMSRNPGVTFIY